MSKKSEQVKKGRNLRKGMGDLGPPVPYKLSWQMTEAQWAEMLKQPVLVVTGEFPEPVKRNGEVFRWFVHPVRFDVEGKPINLGRQIFCHDEVEALRERDFILEQCRQEEESRQRGERERPVPATVLKSVEIIRGQHLDLDAIVLSRLPQAAGADTPAQELPADKPFVGVCHAYWNGKDGSGQAALGIARRAYEFVKVLRLVEYLEPVQRDGKSCAFGVELAECKLDMQPIRVLERWYCCSSSDGDTMFARKTTEVPALRARFAPNEKPDALARNEDAIILQLETLAEKSYDPAAKAAHLGRVAEIKRARAEREKLARAAAIAEARVKEQQHAAFARLIEEYFPAVHEVKSRLKDSRKEHTPEEKEELRRAMRIDCARLGIQSPFNNFALDGKLAVEVCAAMNAKSPVKPEQVEAVLNWMAKGYAEMPQADWTAAVQESVGQPVNGVGLAKTVYQKFGLRSHVKGRPVK